MTTRAERFTACLSQAEFDDRGISLNELARELLAIADDRELMTVGDLAGLINRNTSTVISWMSRQQHGIPRPVFPVRPRTPMLFDADECRAWAAAHPKLAREA